MSQTVRCRDSFERPQTLGGMRAVAVLVLAVISLLALLSGCSSKPVAAAGAVTTATSKSGPDQSVVFNQPVWDGMLYDAAYHSSDAAKLAAADRYSDVSLPLPPPKSEDLWQKGGIIHLYGGGTPRVVVLGSSHALMYANQIDMICRELHLSVSFLCSNGRPAIQQTSYDKMAAYYAAQQRYLRKWKPDLVLVVDRWDARGHDTTLFAAALDDYLTMLQSYASHTVLFTQPPVLSVGEYVNLRKYVFWYDKANSHLPVLQPNSDEALRKQTVGIFRAEAKKHPDLRILQADQFFYNADMSVKYLVGSDYLYADDDHLTEAGAALLHDPIRNAIVSGCGLTSQ